MPLGLKNVVAIAAGGSHSLALVGAGPPLLAKLLVSRTVAYGTTVWLGATAAGASPLRYQWRLNGTNLVGATHPMLVLTDVQFKQAGAYSVVVTNPLGSLTSSDLVLDVLPLVFIDQPQSQKTWQGATASFTATASGRGPFIHQWRFNGKDLPGATHRTLVLTNLQWHQAGSYAVTASNPWGAATSASATLSVGPVAAWGVSGSSAQPSLPPSSLTNAVAVAAGFLQSLALRPDGTVVAWDNNGTENPSAMAAELTNIVAVAAGNADDVVGFIWGQLLALRADGTVVAWGIDGQWKTAWATNVPAGLTQVVAVAAGPHHNLALRADGTVVAWGYEWAEQAIHVPVGLTNVVAVAAGLGHSLALRADGTVVAWGDNPWYAGITNVPPDLSSVVAVATGQRHSLALRADGTVVAWGSEEEAQAIDVPVGLTNVVAVAAGPRHSLALRADGTVVAWGGSPSGWQTADVSSGLTNVLAVAAGHRYSLALIGDGPPVIKASLSHPTWNAEGLSVSLPTQSGRVYALEYKDSLADAAWTPLPLVAGTGHERTLTDPTPTGAQRFYRVRRW